MTQFNKDDYTWITDLGDTDLYRNDEETNTFAQIDHDNIKTNRIRVATFNDQQVQDLLETVSEFDNADDTDTASEAETHISELIQNNEIKQYINGELQ